MHNSGARFEPWWHGRHRSDSEKLVEAGRCQGTALPPLVVLQERPARPPHLAPSNNASEQGSVRIGIYLVVIVLAIEDATVGHDKPAHIGNTRGAGVTRTSQAHGRPRARTHSGAGREGRDSPPQDDRGSGNEASGGRQLTRHISSATPPFHSTSAGNCLVLPRPREQSRTRVVGFLGNFADRSERNGRNGVPRNSDSDIGTEVSDRRSQ